MKRALDEENDKAQVELISSWPPASVSSENNGKAEKKDQIDNVQHSINHSGSRLTFGRPSTSFMRNPHRRSTGNENTQNRAPKIKMAVKEKVDLSKYMATTAVALWWKSNKPVMEKFKDQMPSSNSPNTMINFICGLEETKHFMRERVEHMESEGIPVDRSKSSYYAIKGSFHERLGELKDAKSCLDSAVEEGLKEDCDEVNEYRWLLHRVRRKLAIENQQNIAKQEIESRKTSNSGTSFPPYEQVEKRSANDLSLYEFITEFSLKSCPVVITDLAISVHKWDFKHIKDTAGECNVQVKKLVPGSAEWAQLEDAETMTVSEYINLIQSGKNERYLFDWSLPIHCPSLLADIKIPKYFADDFLQKTPVNTLYRDSWPSLFIGPAGLNSELHVDAFGSNFWMALFQGKKRWVFFSKSDLPYLYPEYTHSMDPVFPVKLSKPDVQKYPLLELTKPRECILSPGEVLFVPAGCPHRVENLEDSIAISANFVDRSNIDLVISELQINSLVNQRARELIQQLQPINMYHKWNYELKDRTWEEFKNPRTYNNIHINTD